MVQPTKSKDRFFSAVLKLTSVEECYAFFEDLCTIKEIDDMTQRLDTAVLLDSGLNYQKIEEKVKVSSATICRVNRCLQYGTGGYRSALDKMTKEEKEV